MHPARSLSRRADSAVHHVLDALLAIVLVAGAWLFLASVCRLILALGWYVS